MANIVFDKEKFARLKLAYEEAVRDGVEVFTFEGHEIIPAYAKYMIEYLEGRLNEKRS